MNSQDFTGVEKLLDTKQISSHTSQLTNLRQHMLEESLDKVRIQVKREPTVENIIAYYGVLDSLFSYLLSLQQEGASEEKKADRFGQLMDKTTPMMKKLKSYWAWFRFSRSDAIVEELKRRDPRRFRRNIEYESAALCDAVADNLRAIYQSMNFYFRTEQVSQARGAIGDLLRSVENLKKKKEVAHEV